MCTTPSPLTDLASVDTPLNTSYTSNKNNTRYNYIDDKELFKNDTINESDEESEDKSFSSKMFETPMRNINSKEKEISQFLSTIRANNNSNKNSDPIQYSFPNLEPTTLNNVTTMQMYLPQQYIGKASDPWRKPDKKIENTESNPALANSYLSYNMALNNLKAKRGPKPKNKNMIDTSIQQSEFFSKEKKKDKDLLKQKKDREPYQTKKKKLLAKENAKQMYDEIYSSKTALEQGFTPGTMTSSPSITSSPTISSSPIISSSPPINSYYSNQLGTKLITPTNTSMNSLLSALSTQTSSTVSPPNPSKISPKLSTTISPKSYSPLNPHDYSFFQNPTRMDLPGSYSALQKNLENYSKPIYTPASTNVSSSKSTSNMIKKTDSGDSNTMTSSDESIPLPKYNKEKINVDLYA